MHLMETIEFSNIHTKINFQYQANPMRSGELSSITVFYNNTMGVKVQTKEGVNDIEELFIEFENIILGKIFGGVFLEKYPKEEDVYCYLIYDGYQNHKIGKSLYPNSRLQQLQTGSPRAKLIKYSPFITEKFLHDVYAHKRDAREWFDLSGFDVLTIISLMDADNQETANVLMRMFARQIKKNKPKRSEIKAKKEQDDEKKISKVKFTFGKYNGVTISEMNTLPEKRYLIWFLASATNKKTLIYKAAQKYCK